MPGVFTNLTLLDLLHRASQCAERVFEAHTREFQLTSREFLLLSVIAKNEGISQTRIVQVTGIDRSTVSQLVRRLVSRGHVKRRRTKHDARAYEICLTSAGKALLEAVAPAAKQADAVITARIQNLPCEQLRDALIELIVVKESPSTLMLGGELSWRELVS